jgi:hypothetical protein
VRRKPPGPSRGGRVAAAGVVILVAYVALAGISGRLSPLARRPLLDGTVTPQPYHWVTPPADLASTNIQPSVLTFSLPLTPKGVQGGGPSSGDGQITVIVSDGSIGPHDADTSVRFDVTPVDPATLSELGHDLVPFGNAVRIEGTYLPSDTPVRTLKDPLDVILFYPVTVTLHTSKYEMAASLDGKTWTAHGGTVFANQQQVESPIAEPGYVVVAGIPGAAPVSVSPVGPSGGSKAIALGLMVAAGCALIVGLGLVLRSRRP